MGETKQPKPRDYKTFSDHFGAVDFHPKSPKRDLVDVVDKPCLILDCHIVKGFKSVFGESDFALVYMRDITDNEEFTTLCGGEVVLKKLAEAKKENLLPLFGTIVKPAHYYDII